MTTFFKQHSLQNCSLLQKLAYPFHRCRFEAVGSAFGGVLVNSISTDTSQLCFCGWLVFVVLVGFFLFCRGWGKDGELWRAGSHSNCSGLISFSLAKGEQVHRFTV